MNGRREMARAATKAAVVAGGVVSVWWKPILLGHSPAQTGEVRIWQRERAWGGEGYRRRMDWWREKECSGAESTHKTLAVKAEGGM